MPGSPRSLEQRLLAVAGERDVVALQPQRAAQRVADRLVVVDNEDRHTVIVRMWLKTRLMTLITC